MKHLAFLACLLPSIAWAQATAVITGPTEASPGDLIILDASQSNADSRQWLLVGSDKSYLQFEEGRKCVFASGAVGQYHFVLSTAKCEDSVASLASSIHTITIGTPGPTPPTPPKPDPQPEPQPDLTGISKEAHDAAKTVNRKAGEAAGIAAELESIAGKAAGLGWTASQIAAACKTISVLQGDDAKQRWTAFNAAFGRIMQSATNHVEAIEQIAAGLRAVDVVQAVGDPANETIRSMLDTLRRDLKGIASEVGQ